MDHPLTYDDYQAVRQERVRALREKLSDQLGSTPRITLEIGSGHGHFLNAYAAAHRDRICVGIDILLYRLHRSEKKRDRGRVENLQFFRASAEDFLLAMPSGLLLEDVFILFPDPWPKRRHQKNRLITSSFLSDLAAKSLPGARLCFRTDHEEYFSAASSVVTQHLDWRVEPAAPWPFEQPTVFQNRAASYQSLIAVRKPS